MATFIHKRTLSITLLVLLIHVGLLWALHLGLRAQKAQEVVVTPVAIINEVQLPTPKLDTKPKQEMPTVAPRPSPVVTPKPTPPQPAPPRLKAPSTPRDNVLVTDQPSAPATLAQPEPTPAPSAAKAEDAASASVPSSASASAASASDKAKSSAPTPPRSEAVELPLHDAAYLNNPKPPYPPVSRQLNEQGLAQVRVFVAIDGTATQALLESSSGFSRLDNVAIATALRWRYVPGKRGSTPEAMWVTVPIRFELN